MSVGMSLALLIVEVVAVAVYHKMNSGAADRWHYCLVTLVHLLHYGLVGHSRFHSHFSDVPVVHSCFLLFLG